MMADSRMRKAPRDAAVFWKPDTVAALARKPHAPTCERCERVSDTC
jgi:hypothetical protein